MRLGCQSPNNHVDYLCSSYRGGSHPKVPRLIGHLSYDNERTAIVFDRVGCFALSDYEPAADSIVAAASSSSSSSSSTSSSSSATCGTTFNDEVVAQWIRNVQEQLVKLHDAGLGHCDVKPCNIVVYKDVQDHHYATLIDFEHVVELAALVNTTFSATVRYASRRIIAVSDAGRQALPYDFQYLAQDDFESLFYTAFETFTKHKRLPWAQLAAGKEPLTLRNQLMTDDDVWKTYESSFTEYAWKLLCVARHNITRLPTLPPFRNCAQPQYSRYCE